MNGKTGFNGLHTFLKSFKTPILSLLDAAEILWGTELVSMEATPSNTVDSRYLKVQRTL